jgi:hypothetical protein
MPGRYGAGHRRRSENGIFGQRLRVLPQRPVESICKKHRRGRFRLVQAINDVRRLHWIKSRVRSSNIANGIPA